MLLKTLRFIGIACAAIALGLTTAHVLEWPGKAQLSGTTWLTIQQTFYGGFGVLGGVAEIVGLLAALGTLALIRGRRRSTVLTLLAALAFAGMLLSYFFGNRPINADIAVWTAATLPPDWANYRDQWELAHAISAVFAVVALTTQLVAVLRERPEDARLAANEAAPAAAVPEQVAKAG